MKADEPRSPSGSGLRRSGRSRPTTWSSLANLVRELAVYEKLEDHARATPDDFRRHLFGPRPGGRGGDRRGGRTSRPDSPSGSRPSRHSAASRGSTSKISS